MTITLLTTCSNCGMLDVTWSENLRKNSRGEMRHWLINQNGTDHKCMGWSTQGYRDAKIPAPYSARQLKYFKEVSGPNGLKGAKEISRLIQMCKPSQIMVDAYNAEMKAKGKQIDSPPPSPPAQQRL